LKILRRSVVKHTRKEVETQGALLCYPTEATHSVLRSRQSPFAGTPLLPHLTKVA